MLRHESAQSETDRAGVRIAAVVVAGGAGERFGAAGGKQLARVADLPVLGHTLAALDASVMLTEYVIVVHPDRVEEYRSQAVEPVMLARPAVVVAGGDSRTESVRRGLAAVAAEVEVIAVHDGARPLVTGACLDSALRALLDEPVDGVVVGHPAYDTLKAVEGTRVIGTVDRSRFWIAQTPQVFHARILRDAYDRASGEGFIGTDDASMVENAGGVIRMIEGPRENIKVTVAEDLQIVAAMLRQREGS